MKRQREVAIRGALGASPSSIFAHFDGERDAGNSGWSKPQDGKLTIYASVESAFLTGKSEVHLREDRDPSVSIGLQAETSANLKGMIVDGSGNGVAGARVEVAGYENEAIITGAGGSFSLPAHAGNGQMVRLHAQKNGYVAANEYFPAGDSPATIVMTKK